MARSLILDTNVISALMVSDPVIADWADGFAETQLFLTAITKAEILFGVEKLPQGRRKEELRRTAEAALAEFPSRILPFDEAAAEHYARQLAWRKQHGRIVGTADIQIAAIAAVHRAIVVTHNTRDFVDSAVEVIDPWQS